MITLPAINVVLGNYWSPLSRLSLARMVILSLRVHCTYWKDSYCCCCCH